LRAGCLRKSRARNREACALKKLAVAKIREEGEELAEALEKKGRKEIIWEACDLLYHALVAVRARGITLLTWSASLEDGMGKKAKEKIKNGQKGWKKQAKKRNEKEKTERI